MLTYNVSGIFAARQTLTPPFLFSSN